MKFEENGYTRFEFLEGMSMKVGNVLLSTWLCLWRHTCGGGAWGLVGVYMYLHR